MDYQKIYDNIIEKAKNRELTGYVEKHHIIPRCMNGTDDLSNIAILTAREHFIAHQLLVMMYPDNWKLALALRFMTNATGKQIRNNREFEWIRIKAAKANGMILKGKKRPPRSKEWCEKLSIAHSNKKLSDETKSKISSALKGVKKSDEMKKNMSIVAKNRTKEHQEKLNATHRGKKRSESTILKMKESVKKQPLITCPHCGKIGKPRGMKFWHFDKCKEKNNGI